jgi:hypothetical protein
VKSQAANKSLTIENRIKIFSELPYKKGIFASRSWGHPFHSIMSYPSKLKPSIAFYLVNLFTEQDDIVLDPFSGVGTVPFEACSQRRYGIGSDLSPVAFNVTRAKVNPPTIQQADEHLSRLNKFIEENKQSIEMDVEDELVSYYHPDTLKEILAAKEFFEKNSEEALSFVLSCLLHILHGNRPYALSRRSHNVMPWPPKGEFKYKSLMKSLREKVYRMLLPDLPICFVRGRAVQDDVFNLSFEESSIDCILTSPPFFANRDFLRMNRIRLWFCGWNYKKQKEMKTVFLENKKNLSAYQAIFNQFHKVLKPEKLCIMHLGVVGRVDMAKQIAPYATEEGFKVSSILYEDTSALESHGIVDRGATQHHQFLILRKV